MGYSSTFMAPVAQTIADFHQHLGALVQLLTTDGTTLHNQATSLHAISIQGATADALVQITETYHEYVTKNTDLVTQIVIATQKFHDAINTTSATCDTAISANAIAEYLFVTQPLLNVAAIFTDPYTIVDNAVATAYKALAYPNGVPVRDGPMTVYDDDQQAARGALETWARAIQMAHDDWTNALGNNSSSLPTTVPSIPGVTVDPQQVQMLFNDINTISAPNGVMNMHLSVPDATTANNLFVEWQNKSPGLTLGFIEAMMASKFSQAQIVALLGVWPNLNWKQWVMVGSNALKLLLGYNHMFIEKNLDVTNTTPPRPSVSAPVKGASGKVGGSGGGDGGFGPDENGNFTIKSANGDTFTIHVNKPTESLPPPGGGSSGGSSGGGGGTTPDEPGGTGGVGTGTGDTPLGPEDPIGPLEPFGPGEIPFDI